MIRIPLSLLKRNYLLSQWSVFNKNKVLFSDRKDITYGIATTFTRQELMQISSPHTQQLLELLAINQKNKNIQITPQNLQKAQQIMRKIEQTYPEKQQIHTILAKSFLIQKNYDAAIRQYNKAWKLSPDNPQYGINIAICLIEAQNYYDAIKILEKQALKHENSSQIYHLLATAYLMIQNYSQAIENFHKSYEKNNKLSQDFMQYVRKVKQEGNYMKATPLFIKWLMHDCENEEVLNGLKHCFISSGRIEEAKEFYNSLGEIQNYKSAVKHSLALFYFQIGQKDKAKEYLLQAIQSRPNNYQLNLYLSTIYILEDNSIEAIACLQKCLKINPSDPNVLNSLGLIHTKLKEFQKAHNFYCESVRLNQEDSMSWYGLGVSFIQRNEVQKGIKNLRKAIQLDQRNYPALEKLGSTLHLLGDEKQAQILFNRAQMIKQQLQKL